MGLKERMDVARELIQNGDYAAADALLSTINHPKAAEWRAKIAPKLSKVEAWDDLQDPFGNMPRGERPTSTTHNYTTQLVVTIILYLIGIIPGVIANSLWAKSGQRLEDATGEQIPGVGALVLMNKFVFWIVFVLPVALFFLWIIVLFVAG